MKEILLNKKWGNMGKYVALVDDDDFEYLNQFNWTAEIKSNTIYAARTKKTIKMHREIMKAQSNSVIDHIDHNGLNNQKSNLRICTISENSKNKIPYGTSKYLGVSLHVSKYSKYNFSIGAEKVYYSKPKWKAAIKADKYIHLGLFKDEVDAAKAYDNAARKYHGEFANLNFK